MSEYVCACGEKFPLDGKTTACPKCKMSVRFSVATPPSVALPPSIALPPSVATPPSSKMEPTEIDKTTAFLPESEPEPEPEASRVAEVKSQEQPAGGYHGHRVLREHARGGMGKVSVAVDEALNREVALKELAGHATEDETALERFRDEAEITARLEHPGVVPVHAFGLDAAGRPFYTMKFIHGKTLQKAIKEYHALPDSPEKAAAFRELLRRFASVCQTMEFAHQRGILHRDLKPANIMLGEFGETLVMDWGLAKPITEEGDATVGDLASAEVSSRPSHTESGSVIGTPAYMSPEQAAGDVAAMGPRSDVYSLGAILYQILTGRAPYTGKSSREIIQKVLAGEPKFASEMKKSVPKALEAIAMCALSRDPDSRYADAGTLYRDVMNWLDDEPVFAHPDTRYERIWRWVRKNRALATTLFISALLLLTLLGTTGVVVQRARTQTLAAEMMAREMARKAAEEKRKAEEISAKLTAKELELMEKKAELEAARMRLGTLTEETERAAEEAHIRQLEAEVARLETEVEELRRQLAQTSHGLGIEEKLAVLLTEIDAAKAKYYALTEEMRALDASIAAMEDAKQPREEKDAAWQELIQKHRQWRMACHTLNRLRNEAMVLAKWSKDHDSGEITRLSDRLTPDWDVICSENGLFVADCIRERSVKHTDMIVRNALADNAPVLADKACDKWILAHAPSRLLLAVPEGVNRFTAVGGVNKKAPYQGINVKMDRTSDMARSNLWMYLIKADGELLYISENLHYYHDQFVFMDVPLPPGTKTVELIAESGGNEEGDWAYWGWPMFHWQPREGENAPNAAPAEDFEVKEADGGVTVTKYTGSARHVIIPAWIGGKRVLRIAADAFMELASRSITMPETLLVIDARAIRQCRQLERIRLPPSVLRISGMFVDGCPALQECQVNKANPYFHVIDDVLFSRDGKTLHLYPANKKGKEYVTPPGVEKIEAMAFMHCQHLVTVTISEGVRDIGRYLFYGSASLAEARLPESIGYISDNCFDQCQNLKKIKLGEKVGYLGWYCFAGCRQLEEINIPDCVGAMGRGVFAGCELIKEFTIPKGLHNTTDETFLGSAIERFYVPDESGRFSAIDGILFNKDKTHLAFYPHRRQETTYVVPQGVVAIGWKACRGNGHLTEVVFPEGLTYIGVLAFANCRNLRTVVFPESLGSIGDQAFVDTGVRSIRIPGGVKEIRGGVFGWLSNVEFAEGVERIVNGAFGGCGITTITLPKSVTAVGERCFSNCKNLEQFIVLNRETTFDDSALENSDLEKLTIRAPPGSTAEAFAKAKGIRFVPLEETPAR